MCFFPLSSDRAYPIFKIKMRNFKELKIWQKGVDISVNCLDIVQSFPRDMRFELSSQIIRAGVSIPSNIAEGSSRSSDKDYNRFIIISLGSSFELETQLIIAQKKQFGNQQLITETLAQITEEQKMLSIFSSVLKKPKAKS